MYMWMLQRTPHVLGLWSSIIASNQGLPSLYIKVELPLHKHLMLHKEGVGAWLEQITSEWGWLAHFTTLCTYALLPESVDLDIILVMYNVCMHTCIHVA
jgi:hypothetical protein